MPFLPYQLSWVLLVLDGAAMVCLSYGVSTFVKKRYRPRANLSQLVVWLIGFTAGVCCFVDIGVIKSTHHDGDSLGLGSIVPLTIAFMALILGALLVRLSIDVLEGIKKDRQYERAVPLQICLGAATIALGFIAPSLLQHIV
jgi:magnesium-transporting ATPase (P-type)